MKRHIKRRRCPEITRYDDVDRAYDECREAEYNPSYDDRLDDGFAMMDGHAD